MENGDWKKAKEEVFMNGSYLSGLELKKQHGVSDLFILYIHVCPFLSSDS